MKSINTICTTQLGGVPPHDLKIAPALLTQLARVACCVVGLGLCSTTGPRSGGCMSAHLNLEGVLAVIPVAGPLQGQLTDTSSNLVGGRPRSRSPWTESGPVSQCLGWRTVGSKRQQLGWASVFIPTLLLGTLGLEVLRPHAVFVESTKARNGKEAIIPARNGIVHGNIIMGCVTRLSWLMLSSS